MTDLSAAWGPALVMGYRRIKSITAERSATPWNFLTFCL